MRRRHHLDAALRSFSPAKKAGVSAEAPSLLLLSCSAFLFVAGINLSDLLRRSLSAKNDAFSAHFLLPRTASGCAAQRRTLHFLLIPDACSIEPKMGSQLALLRTPHAGQLRLQRPK